MSKCEGQLKEILSEKGLTLDEYRQRIADYLRTQFSQAYGHVSSGRSVEATNLLSDGLQNVLEEFVSSPEAKAIVNGIRQSHYEVLADKREIQQAGGVQLERAVDIMDSLYARLGHPKTRNRILELKALMQSSKRSFVKRQEFLDYLFDGSESSTVRHFLSKVNGTIPAIDPRVRLVGFPHGNSNSKFERWVGFVFGDCSDEELQEELERTSPKG